MATQNYFKVKNGLEFPSIETLQTTDNTGPSVKPSLNLDFAKTKALDPRVTFTRASTATCYDGETIAKAEENLLTYSQDFDNAAWTKSGLTGVTANATTAPDGTTTADKIVEDSTTSTFHFLSQSISKPASAIPYTFTLYAKAAERQFIHITIFDNVSAFNRFTFDLINGVVGQASVVGGGGFSGLTTFISFVGNGWYRIGCTFTSNTVSQLATHIHMTQSDSVGLYTGTSGSGIYVWGAQLEQRAYATAYTPTTSSPITNCIPVLQTAATNIARFDHDPITGESKGLLIEEQRTNMFLASYELSNPYWNKTRSSISANAIIAPDSSNTACKLIEDTTASNSHYMYQPVSGIINGTSYTYSVFVKKAERTNCAIQFYNTNGTFTSGAANFDLTTGTVTNKDASITTATISSVGNGWYRITATSQAIASSNGNVAVHLASATNTTAYTGDGVSGMYMWGPQLETGTFATSYIPTSLTYSGRASTATYKAADGLIRTAATNTVRYEPNTSGGNNILLENSVTNYHATDPADWSTPGTSLKLTRCYSAIAAPDGSLTATRITRNGTNGFNMGTISHGQSNGTMLTWSFWARTIGSANQSVVIYIEEDSPYTSNYTTITVTPTWQRFSLSKSVGGTNWRTSFRADTGVTDPWDILVWGNQAEVGSTPTSVIPQRFTHTGRSSTATYYDSTGTIRTAVSGQPRYTYNPSLLSAPPKLILEGAATNLQAYSIDGANGGWLGNGNSSTTETTTPNGLNSACVKLSSDATATPNVSTSALFSATSNNVYTYSIFVKPFGSHDVVSLWFDKGDGQIGCTSQFKLSTLQHMNMATRGGMTFVSNSIQVLPGGWYRLSMTATGTFPTSCQIRIYVAQAANYGSNNDGYGSATGTIQSGSGMYAWGAQVELGYAATSYIPTTSTQVTRAADTFTSAVQTRAADVYSSSQVTRSAEVTKVTGSNFTSWYRQDQGTIYAEANVGSGLFPYVYGLTDGTDSNRHILYRIGGSATGSTWFDPLISTNGVSQTVSTAVIPATTTKFAHAFKTNDVADAGDGVIYQTDSSVTLPNINSLFIGSNGTTFFANGYIKKIAYYPKRLTNAELVSITS